LVSGRPGIDSAANAASRGSIIFFICSPLKCEIEYGKNGKGGLLL
jgi:hypothetical protein